MFGVVLSSDHSKLKILDIQAVFAFHDTILTESQALQNHIVTLYGPVVIKSVATWYCAKYISANDREINAKDPHAQF